MNEPPQVLLLHELAQRLAVASLAVETLEIMLQNQDMERARQQCAVANAALDAANAALRAAKRAQMRTATIGPDAEPNAAPAC